MTWINYWQQSTHNVGSGFAVEIIQTRHQDPEEICLEKEAQEMRFGDKKSLDEIIQIDL